MQVFYFKILGTAMEEEEEGKHIYILDLKMQTQSKPHLNFACVLPASGLPLLTDEDFMAPADNL